MEEDERQLRPDVRFTLDKIRVNEGEDYNLEEEQDGFVCHDCGWRSLTLPLNTDFSDNFTNDMCPECGAEEVENTLSSHISQITAIYNSVAVYDGFVPYQYLCDQFDPPQDRLDEAINHLITNREAYVVFEDGSPLVHITRE